MTDQERQMVESIVNELQEYEQLQGREWQSLTYWSKGVGVALRRYRFYSEHLRISKKIDFHIYISLEDDLNVFNKVSGKLPDLERWVNSEYANNGVSLSYEREAARDVNTQRLKKSMVLAHFYVPVNEMNILCEVYSKVSNVLEEIEKGDEVRPRGQRGEDDDIFEIENLQNDNESRSDEMQEEIKQCLTMQNVSQKDIEIDKQR